jgi:Fic family protein
VILYHARFVPVSPITSSLRSILYYDGNGRTARLLATLILHLGGYDLKGLYSLEEYYARNLGKYYQALTVGLSHNYYEGRAGTDITAWIEYFCEGVASSFENVRHRAQEAAGVAQA